jgi:hypothetical protein
MRPHTKTGDEPRVLIEIARFSNRCVAELDEQRIGAREIANSHGVNPFVANYRPVGTHSDSREDAVTFTRGNIPNGRERTVAAQRTNIVNRPLRRRFSAPAFDHSKE